MKHVTIAAVLLLAACSGGGNEGNNSSDSDGQTVEQTPANLQDDQTNSVVPLSPPTPAPTPTASPIASLPSGFQGRWGLVDNDCIPGRADAKGLMIVAADGLGFYESRGAVRKAEAIRENTLQLDLAFTGEGQEWNRTQTLTLLDGGKTLVREEQKPAGSFRYVKCPAGKETPVDQRGA